MTDRAVMQQALDALEAKGDAWIVLERKAITALREALAEQSAQQEPVAVVSGYYGGKCVILPIDPARIFNSNTALYTSPPARKPLTDKEIDSFREANSEGRGAGWRFNYKGFARAIEAVHGIKGDA